MCNILDLYGLLFVSNSRKSIIIQNTKSLSFLIFCQNEFDIFSQFRFPLKLETVLDSSNNLKILLEIEILVVIRGSIILLGDCHLLIFGGYSRFFWGHLFLVFDLAFGHLG